jgi:hypothetical protein
MVTLLLTAAGIAAFEVAAVKYGSDSRVDTAAEAPTGAASHSSARRWI